MNITSNVTSDMKSIRKLAHKRQTPLLRVDFDNSVSFVYAELEDGDWLEKEYVYRDFETALERELDRLGV